MPFAHVNGINLCYELNGEGPPVVFAHGGGSNHLSWWKQAYGLKDKYMVVTFDHRSFGQSEVGDKGPDTFDDDLLGLLDHLKIEGAALVGQSMGGRTVAALTSKHPDRVKAMVLTSGSGGLLPMPTDGHSARAAAAAGAAKSFAEFLKSDRDRDGFSRRDPEQYFLFESIGLLSERVDTQWLMQMSKTRYDLAPIIAAKIPTLLIAGEEDTSNCAIGRELATLLPGARFTSIPNCGHHLFFEQSAIFNRLLREFLDEHMAPTKKAKLETA
jgi:3-oxoadipate enol-lactonase